MPPIAIAIITGGVAWALHGVAPGLLAGSARSEALIPALDSIASAVIVAGMAKIAWEWWKEARSRGRLERYRTVEQLRTMDWAEFEELVAQGFRDRGYAVAENTIAGADDGVDLELTYKGSRTVVQCKRYKTKVGAPVVRELMGTRVAMRADKAMLVAASGFTGPARELAEREKVELVDGNGLLRVLGRNGH